MPIDPSFAFAGRSLVRDVFVETGFCRGATAFAAAAAGFAKVHSIEFDAGRYRAGLVEVGRRYPDGRVTLHHGTSPDVLPHVIAPDRRTTFYLDGHFSGDGEGGRDPQYGECPLVAELAVITAAPWADRPVIVVDDAQMFRRPWDDDLRRRFDVAQWPTRADIDRLLPGYAIIEDAYTLYAWPRG